MNSIFQEIPLKRRSLFQVLFNQHPDENAVISLNNLFASNRIKELEKTEIQNIEAKYSLVLKDEFPLNLEEFYAVYLNQCLRNNRLSEDELDNLAHLKEILSLDSTVTSELNQLIGVSAYRDMFHKSMEDGTIDNVEREKLRTLFEKLQLPESSIRLIENTAKTAYINQRAQSLVDALRYTPSDERMLKEVAENLNVDWKAEGSLKRQLERLGFYWTIENNPLQSITVDEELQKTEVCYLTIPGVKWFDLKNGSTLPNLKIDECIRLTKKAFVDHSSRPIKYHASDMKLIQTGTIYLTNKRVLLIGSVKNSNVRLDKIRDFISYEDGIEIRKDTGKNPLLVFPRNGDSFGLFLGKLLTSHNY